MLKIKFIIPTANTHPNDAKWQHLVPRTYMRAWSYNQTNSVYVVMKNRLEEGIQPKNVETLNYKVGFHDIKAGDLFVPDEALNDLYGFMMDYDVLCGNIKLQKFTPISYGDLLPRNIKGEEERKGMRKREREREGRGEQHRWPQLFKYIRKLCLIFFVLILLGNFVRYS